MIDTKLVSTPPAALRALKDLYSWAEELHLVYAWASSADGTDEHWTALPQSRVRRAIIGVHFARTEPLVQDATLDACRLLWLRADRRREEAVPGQ
jgi:hypothetical protein